jgi:hypothetical protein
VTILDGLTPAQRDHARVMVQTVSSQGFPQRAAVIVMETALVESGIKIYANSNVPESLAIPHEAVGSDHRSVGILQQQVPYWGTAADCMDPATATVKFLFGGSGGSAGLKDFDWQHMTTGQAAQAVQVSAFPDRYQQQEQTATQLVGALWPASHTPDAGTVRPLTPTTAPTEDEDMYTLYQIPVGHPNAGRQYAVREGSLPIWLSPRDKTAFSRFRWFKNDPDKPYVILQAQIDDLIVAVKKGAL